VDIEGKPAEQLEWDMKMWWPHTEALYATALAWRITNDVKYYNWFETLHEYSFSRFADDEHGEWFGYLHRNGTISNTLKGNIFKGPFHLPRTLILLSDLFLRNDLDGYFPL
jgi:N-acylglucosamine 2-epimerase